MTVDPVNPWLGIGFVLFCTMGLMASLKFYQCRYAPDPEWVRKLMHMGGGTIALSLPWLFHCFWPVFILCMVSLLQLCATRYTKGLRKRFGSVLGSVKRDSIGEFFFPIGVVVLFYLSNGNPLFYTTPLLCLTFADTAAALVGQHYGKRRLMGNQKSIEGSLSFCMVAFLCIQMSLQAFTQMPALGIGLTAISVAMILTLVEAVADHGSDNVLIPVLGFFLLRAALQPVFVAILLLGVFAMLFYLLFVYTKMPPSAKTHGFNRGMNRI